MGYLKQFILFSFLLISSFTSNAATYNVISGSYHIAGIGSDSHGNEGGIFRDGDYSSHALSNLMFFGCCFHTYFDPYISSVFSERVGPADYAPPSIDLDTMTADFSSFQYEMLSATLNAPSTPVITDNLDNTYTLNWDNLIVGGPFDGFTVDFEMTVQPVPLPATIGLLSVALLGLNVFKIKKKSA